VSNRSDRASHRVTIYFKRAYDEMFYKSKESATAAVAKLKEDAAGYGDVTVEDDFGKVIDFRADDYSRAVTIPMD
jgi:hypothetical protein